MSKGCRVCGVEGLLSVWCRRLVECGVEGLLSVVSKAC